MDLLSRIVAKLIWVRMESKTSGLVGRLGKFNMISSMPCSLVSLIDSFVNSQATNK